MTGYDLFQRMDETIARMTIGRAVGENFAVDVEETAVVKGALRQELHGGASVNVLRTVSQSTIIVL